ncbi:MAG: AmmeMemoRadiSam system radical SAM enzyme [Epsilonproteobacteria bacterium]|nr:AmmeMemoRadiSam system radical SAM enzyme [Campylobacterota bacterium]
MHYFRVEDEKIICLLCQHYCKLKEGQVGICGVNQNQNSILKNLVYGRVVALHVDPVEKKPLYHFLPGTLSLSLGTVGCNFRCPFCQNWQISQSKDIARGDLVSAEQVVALALEKGCKSISFTYNEPTIFYPFAKEIALRAKTKGLKSIFVSNGLESAEVIEDMKGVIDGFNVDLKSFDPHYYKKTLKGSLSGVLETLKRLKKGGFWVEVTTLIVPGSNDSRAELQKIASFIANEMDIYTPWHISAFHGDYKMQDTPRTSIEKLLEAKEIGEMAGLKYIYMGNVQTKAVTFCPHCKDGVMTRNRFELLEYRLKDGTCPKCNRAIEGVWL